MTNLREAVANLIAVKGRHHTEIAYQRLIEAYDAALTQPEQEIESDRLHAEDDGCPTEKAVLQRFWREYHAQPEQEPVAQVQVAEDYYPHVVFLDGVDTTSLDQKFLYTAPPLREKNQ